MNARINTLDVKSLVAYPVNGVPELGAIDSGANIFFARELEHIIPELFETEFAPISARSLMPIDTSAKPTDKIITYRQFTKVGSAKIIADYANDVPFVNAFGEEFTGKVRTIAAGAQWTIDEIEASAAEGKPLDRMQAEAAGDVIARKENDVAFNGDATHGLVGLLTDPNIPETTVAVGASAQTEWSTKTGVEMVDDLCACADAIPDSTEEVEVPTEIWISPAQYRLANCTQYNAGTDTSALKWFLENHESVKRVVPVRELKGAFAGGTDGMIALTPDRSKFRLNVVMELNSIAPQMKQLSTQVIWRLRTGGVTVHKPLSLHKCNGI